MISFDTLILLRILGLGLFGFPFLTKTCSSVQDGNVLQAGTGCVPRCAQATHRVGIGRQKFLVSNCRQNRPTVASHHAFRWVCSSSSVASDQKCIVTRVLLTTVLECLGADGSRVERKIQSPSESPDPTNTTSLQDLMKP